MKSLNSIECSFCDKTSDSIEFLQCQIIAQLLPNLRHSPGCTKSVSRQCENKGRNKGGNKGENKGENKSENKGENKGENESMIKDGSQIKTKPLI